MRVCKAVAFISVIGLLFVGCENNSGKIKNSEIKTTQQNKSLVSNFSGNYVSTGYEKRNEGNDWVSVSVKTNGDEINVSVRSRADIKKPTCTLDVVARKLNETVFEASIDGKIVLFNFEGNKLNIATMKEEDSSVLNFYCSGGASIAGNYTIIEGELDENQIDKTLFSKVLMHKDVGFSISSEKDMDGSVVTISPFGLSIGNLLNY